MSSRAQKVEHLGDHLPYELLILRHAHKRTPEDRYQLDWNAYYESFALHARNLFVFLTNGKGSTNFVAEDFVAFTAEKDANVQKLINQDLHWQVFHFGKQRKSDPEKKVGTEGRQEIFDWVERNFKRFERALAKTEFAEHWYPERADPDKVREILLEPARSIATPSNPPQASSGSPQIIR
jgi:hypothetical protein